MKAGRNRSFFSVPLTVRPADNQNKIKIDVYILEDGGQMINNGLIFVFKYKTSLAYRLLALSKTDEISISKSVS